MELIGYFVVLAGSTIANAVFNNFEKHLSWWRRLAKLAAVLTVWRSSARRLAGTRSMLRWHS